MDDLHHGSDARNRTTIVGHGGRMRSTVVGGTGTETVVNGHGASTRAVPPELKNLRELKTDAKTYAVQKGEPLRGGEATLLRCACEGRECIAKIYAKSMESMSSIEKERRSHIYKFANSPEGKEIAVPILDYGTVEIREGGAELKHYLFEIMPFFAQGDMSGYHDTFHSMRQMESVIRQLNRALHAIHQAGLFHLDIKPSNLYYVKERDQILVGDFGVACEQIDGGRVTMTVAGTQGYMAPELSLAMSGNVYTMVTAAADYYSLAPTLASLYLGRDVWEGHEREQVACVMSGQFPSFPQSDEKDRQIYSLLRGLFQMRPESRWGYEQLNTWLLDHTKAPQTESTEGEGREWNGRTYTFKGTVYRDALSLFEGFTADEDRWVAARRCLYQKGLENFFGAFNMDLKDLCNQIVEEQYPLNQNVGLAAFLVKIHPGGNLAWRGKRWKNLQQLAQESRRDPQTMEFLEEMLLNGVLTLWVSELPTDEGEKATRAALYQEISQQEKMAQNSKEIATTWFCCRHMGPKLEVFEASCSTPLELLRQTFQNGAHFYSVSKQFVEKNPLAQKMLGFLSACGYPSAAATFWNGLSTDPYETAQKLMVLFEDIAKKENSDEDLKVVHLSNLKFGPDSYLWVWRQMVQKGTFYKALTVSGAQLLEQIKAVPIPSSEESVSVVMGKGLKLQPYFAQFLGVLQNNALLAEQGMMQGKDIVPQQYGGYIHSAFLGKSAPNMFSTYVQNQS